jgi:hypothetical protein
LGVFADVIELEQVSVCEASSWCVILASNLCVYAEEACHKDLCMYCDCDIQVLQHHHAAEAIKDVMHNIEQAEKEVKEALQVRFDNPLTTCKNSKS